MKILFAILAILSALNLHALNYDYKVVEVGADKDQTWSNLHNWISNNFTSNSVIDSDDKDNGVMEVKYSVCFDSPISRFLAYECNLRIRIEVKDGKFRYKAFAPSISVISNPNLETKYMSYGQIEQGSNDLKFIIRTSEEYNLGELWQIGSPSFDRAIEDTRNRRDEIVKYKNEKDKKKDKPTSDWKNADRLYQIIYSIQHCCDGMLSEQLSSLENELIKQPENW